jgi:predicted dehydrogenase
MIKIGVIGLKRSGTGEIKKIKKTGGFQITGIFDPDFIYAKKISSQLSVPFYESPGDLIARCEAIIFSLPVDNNFNLLIQTLKCSKHLLIKNPLSILLESADELVKLTREANVVVQLGNTERMNPAFKASLKYIKTPVFIDIQRYSKPGKYINEKELILDLLFRDIDIVTSIYRSNIKKVNAIGVSIGGEKVDIVNARLEFDNGSVAMLTLNSVSLSDTLKVQLYQKGEYITIDFIKKQAIIVRLKEGQDKVSQTIKNQFQQEFFFERPKIISVNQDIEELALFRDSIRNKRNLVVGIEEGFITLSIALQIIDKINVHENPFALRR